MSQRRGSVRRRDPRGRPPARQGPRQSEVIIVGGAYHETSYRPAIDRLRGSGLRAAIVLRSQDPKPHLKTAVSDDERDEFEAVVTAFRLSAEAASRDLAVNFSYFTPISPPAIDGLSAEIMEPI